MDMTGGTLQVLPNDQLKLRFANGSVWGSGNCCVRASINELLDSMQMNG